MHGAAGFSKESPGVYCAEDYERYPRATFFGTGDDVEAHEFRGEAEMIGSICSIAEKGG